MLFSSTEFKPKKIKTENDKKAKKRKPGQVSLAEPSAAEVFWFIFFFLKKDVQ